LRLTIVVLGCNWIVTDGKEVALRTAPLILFGFTIASGILLADERVRLALVVEFPHSVAEETRLAMEQEIRDTVQVEWLGIEWRDSGHYDRTEAFDRLLMVRVRGACVADASRLSPRGPLGITHVSDGRILPFIEIDCDRVAYAIGARVFPRGTLAPRAALGRALGRVAAHEMYHVLANTGDHEATGVARACFGDNELLWQPMHLTDASLRREKPLPKQADHQSGGGEE
jgi:hypothetical protein